MVQGRRREWNKFPAMTPSPLVESIFGGLPRRGFGCTLVLSARCAETRLATALTSRSGSDNP